MTPSQDGLSIQQLFGRNMRTSRKSLRYTLSDIADLTKMDRTHLNLVELGKRNASLETMQKIADALGTTVAELLV